MTVGGSVFGVGNMYDQRVVARPAFGAVDTGCGGGVQCIAPKSVDRLCGKSHQSAVSQNFSCLDNGLFVFFGVGSVYGQ